MLVVALAQHARRGSTRLATDLRNGLGNRKEKPWDPRTELWNRMGGIMELRVTGLTREQMDHLNARAATHGMSRTAYVKWQLGGDPRPMSVGERTC